MEDPGKMVADDVILIANSQEELQRLLDTCTSWAERNRLVWKPAKCVIVTDNEDSLTQPLTLAGQTLGCSTEAQYLGIKIKPSGFSKQADKAVELKCRRACTAITSQPFFGPDLPLFTIRALYCTNLRSILLYGSALVTNTNELERIDRLVLQQYFKALLFSKQDVP